MSEIYQSPHSVVGDQKRGNKLVALIIGVTTDMGITLLAGSVFGGIVMFMLLKRGVHQDQLMQQYEKLSPQIMHSPMGYVLTAVGMFASFIGAYLCARYANHREYWLAAVLALVAILVYLLSPAETYSQATMLVLEIVNVGVIFLGTYVHVRNKG